MRLVQSCPWKVLEHAYLMLSNNMPGKPPGQVFALPRLFPLSQGHYLCSFLVLKSPRSSERQSACLEISSFAHLGSCFRENFRNRFLTSSELSVTGSCHVWGRIHVELLSVTSLPNQSFDLVNMSSTLGGIVPHSCGKLYRTPFRRCCKFLVSIDAEFPHLLTKPSARSRQQHTLQTMHRHPLYSTRLRQGRRPLEAVESDISEGIACLCWWIIPPQVLGMTKA